MGKVVILGVFVADTAYRADRMPVMGETILGRSFALGPGGKGSNQAVAAARAGAETHFLTRLGEDAFADMADRIWADAGVTSHARRMADSYTGAAFIFVNDATGDNAIIISPGAAAELSPEDIDESVMARADVFITQLEQPLDAALAGLRSARAAGAATLLNPAPAAELPREMLALCDFITPNETETEALTGLAVLTEADAARAAARLCEMGVGQPIITMGAQGAYLHGHGLVPAISAGPVVETTGAGDAFNGGFAAALSDGRSVLDAVRFGCVVAGISVTRAGAAQSMPSRDEIDTWMATGA